MSAARHERRRAAREQSFLPRVARILAVAMLLSVTLRAQVNIVFIFSDDHACHAIGAYGSRINETPNIDRIAREGAILRQSFCGNSICAPSRATVLTGKHSHANGKRTNGDPFDPEQTTFPALLKKSGYQTAIIGKWHLQCDPHGFDHWDLLPGQGSYYNPDFRTADGRGRIEGYTTDIITEKSLAWLEERDESRPFLLMCQHKAPHRNWAPAPRHLTRFDGRDVPVPPTLFDDHAGRSALLVDNEMSVADHLYWEYDLKVKGAGYPEPFDHAMKNHEYARMNPAQRRVWDAAYEPKNAAFLAAKLEGRELVAWKYQRYVKDYLRCVAAVDESVGSILRYLDENDLARNTIVVYASDQGFYLGDHGWYDKRWMFEESLRMPFVIRWPGRIEPGTSLDALIQNIDYAPTFLEAAGVEVPDDVHGRSFLPLLRGEKTPEPWRDDVYYAYYEQGIHNVPRHEGVRTARHKLMFFPDTAEWNLFDLEVDPSELTSRHAHPRYRAVLADLKRRLRAARARFGADPWPLPRDDD